MLKRIGVVAACLLLTACATGGPSTPRQDMRVGQPVIDKAEANARTARGLVGAQMSLPEAYEAAVFDMALGALQQIQAGLDPTPEYVERTQSLGAFAMDNLFVFHMSTDTQGVGVGIGGERDAEERMYVVAFGALSGAATLQVETRLIAEGWFAGAGREAANGVALSCWIAPDQLYEVCLGGPMDREGIPTVAAEVSFAPLGSTL